MILSNFGDVKNLTFDGEVRKRMELQLISLGFVVY